MGGRLAGAAPGIDNPCPQGYLLFITVAFLGFSDGDNDTVIISSSGGTYEKQTQNFHQGADFVIKTLQIKNGDFFFFLIKYPLPYYYICKNNNTPVL